MRKLMCKYTKLSGSSFRLSILAMYNRTAFYRYLQYIFGQLSTDTLVLILLLRRQYFLHIKHKFVHKNM
jgi:hypothetical protein